MENNQNTTNTTSPVDQKEYMENAKGHLVPKSSINPLDITRDELVQSIIAKVKALQSEMKVFKSMAFGEISSFIELSSEEYGKHVGGKKGNVTISSFNGKLTIQRSIAERLIFDERLNVAKQKIDRCVNRWANGSNNHIKALVEHAFKIDKEQKVNTNSILGLRNLQINDDDEWLEAMECISDSINVQDTKSYVRFYEIDEHGQKQALSLDLAKI